jgi:hypothetical protein
MPADRRSLAALAPWRIALAGDLAANAPSLSDDALTASIDGTIERCLFLRACEGCGALPVGTLRTLAAGTALATTLAALVARLMRERVSAAPPDHGDAALRAFLAALAASPAAPTPDTLGDLRETFHDRPLGRLANGTIGELPRSAARKQGGVYHTPPLIVEHLVAGAVAPLLRERSGAATAHPTILDPACGGGALLLGACRALFAWYRARAPRDGAHPDLARAATGGWQLTRAARARIVRAHLYGVDRDPRALATVRLALLLAIYEGPPGSSGEDLPDLGANLRCGDALLGSDYAPDHDATAPGSHPAATPLAWEMAFPAIMGAGGFDVVLANPPYLSYTGRQAVALPQAQRRYLRARYGDVGWPAAHAYFIALAVGTLARRRCAFVVPDQVGHLERYGALRALITARTTIGEVRYWGEAIFADAITPALTLITDRAGPGPTTVRTARGDSATLPLRGAQPWRATPRGSLLLARLERQGESLGALVGDPGVHTGNCAAALIAPLASAPAGAVPILGGRQVGPYRCAPPQQALRLDHAKRPGEYFAIRPADRYADATFLIRQTADRPIVGPRRGATYFRNSLLALYPPADGRASEYLVGLLNSSLLHYAYKIQVQEASQRAFPQVKIAALRRLPIRRLALDDPEDRAQHDAIVAAVRRMLALHERDTPEAQRAARTLAVRLDRLVYRLYGLDERAIATIEAATGAG